MALHRVRSCQVAEHTAHVPSPSGSACCQTLVHFAGCVRCRGARSPGQTLDLAAICAEAADLPGSYIYGSLALPTWQRRLRGLVSVLVVAVLLLATIVGVCAMQASLSRLEVHFVAEAAQLLVELFETLPTLRHGLDSAGCEMC